MVQAAAALAEFSKNNFRDTAKNGATVFVRVGAFVGVPS